MSGPLPVYLAGERNAYPVFCSASLRRREHALPTLFRFRFRLPGIAILLSCFSVLLVEVKGSVLIMQGHATLQGIAKGFLPSSAQSLIVVGSNRCKACI